MKNQSVDFRLILGILWIFGFPIALLIGGGYLIVASSSSDALILGGALVISSLMCVGFAVLQRKVVDEILSSALGRKNRPK